MRRWERGEISPPEDSIAALAAALEIDVDDLVPSEKPGPATVVVSSPLTPPPPAKAPPAPPAPASPRDEAPPTVVQPQVPGDGERPRPARPPARPEPPTAPSPARPPTRPAEAASVPAGPGTTDRGDTEPWIHFETETIPPPPAPPEPTPAPAVPVSELPTQEVLAPPPPMPQPRVQVVQPKSYLEDPKERVLYTIRMVLTLAFLAVMAVVLVWAVGEFVDVMGTALDLFADTTDVVTPSPSP